MALQSTLLRLRPFACAIAAAAVLAGCGGGSDAGSTQFATVSSASAGVARYSQPLLITVNGARLDSGLTVTSTGCADMTRSTTAPNVSSDTVAYYTCTPSALGEQTIRIVRTIDNTLLGAVSFTMPEPQITSATVGVPRYSQPLLITVSGAQLDGGITVSSAGCADITRSTTAPNVSGDTVAYYTCTPSALGEQTVRIVRIVDNTLLQTVTFNIPEPQVTSATVGAPHYGQPLLITVNGARLENGITVSSAGCADITRSTTAPNVSGDTVAYYTCTPSALGEQTVRIARTADNTLLQTVSFTVPDPQGGGGDPGSTQLATVSSASAGVPRFSQPLLITVNGARLDSGLTVTSTGCADMTRSTTAPNVSSDTVAYYTCTPSAFGAQTIRIVRSIDNTLLETVSFTVPEPQVSSASAGVPRYSQPLLITVNGARLDSGLTVTSAGCADMTRSTTAPNVSSDTVAYYTCTPRALGDQTARIVRTVDSTLLQTVPFTVPEPQVTMAVSNGAGVNGSMVFTLRPDLAPITVDNFLAYVNSGFYEGTIFHRVAPGFVVQGGGFTTAGTLKPPTRAPIALEVGKGLSNVRWSLGMARTAVPDSATSQFYVNLVDNLFLDPGPTSAGYAVFGSVTGNTALVTAIETAPCTPTGAGECVPNPQMVINSAQQTR
jgi:cyclophilin family peptidyl-prolyl cis-trans isomerase